MRGLYQSASLALFSKKYYSEERRTTQTTLVYSLFLRYMLLGCCFACYLLVLLVSPIGNYQAHNLSHYFFYQVCELSMAQPPYQQRNFQKILSNVYTFECPVHHSLDTFYHSHYNNGFSRGSMPDILLYQLARVSSSRLAYFLQKGIRSFLCAHYLGYPVLLRSAVHKCRDIPKKFFDKFCNFLCRETLRPSVSNRLFRLNRLSFPYFNFLAELKYEKPVDFNRVERAFLILSA